MPTSSRRAVWLLVATLVLAGCGGEPPVPTPVAPRTEPPTFETGPMQAPVARALESARLAVLERPDSASSWGLLGMLADAHHLYPQAESCYLRAHELDPDSFYWAYLLAVVQDFLGRDVETIAASFETAMRISPEFPPAHYRYGEALMRKGRLEQAREAYARAVELDPDFAMARRGLGQVLLKLGTPEEAVAMLEQAARLDPTDGVVQGALARGYFLLGDRDRAERAAELSKTLPPQHAVPDPVRFEMEQQAVDSRSLSQRFPARMGNGDFAGAIADLKLLEELAPDSAAIQLHLGACHLALGELETAESYLTRAVELQDDLVDAHLDLATLLSRRGDLTGAEGHYRSAWRHAPERTEIPIGLTRMLEQQGRSDEALALFADAAAGAPADVALRHAWGLALMEQGDYAGAADRFRDALMLDPAALESRYHLAFVLEFLGRIDEARVEYRRVLESAPGHVAAERLAELESPP